MTILAINRQTGGLLVVGGQAVVQTGIDAVETECLHRARTLRGENPLNTNQGINYQELLWEGTPDIAGIEVALTTEFLSVDGVTEVVSLNAVVQTGDEGNTLRYTAVINTQFGSTTVNGTI